MAHFTAPDGDIDVDSDFVNNCQKIHGVELKHMGFGEFVAATPKGEVDFDRMRGKAFEGMSGRPHQMYDRKHGSGAAKWLLEEMEKHHLSEASTAKTASYARTAAAPVPSFDRRPARLSSYSRVAARSIKEIAKDIQTDWPRPHFSAKPYLDAMHSLNGINDQYGQDSARNIVNYFLGNASQWRGPKAKQIKDELKALLKGR